MPQVAGVFIVTIVGCIAASLFAVVEFFYGTRQQASELGTSWISEIREELRFALKCHGNVKVNRDKFIGQVRRKRKVKFYLKLMEKISGVYSTVTNLFACNEPRCVHLLRVSCEILRHRPFASVVEPRSRVISASNFLNIWVLTSRKIFYSRS